MAKYQTASYMMSCKINDFTSMFLIPPKFVKKYGEIAAQVSVMLETDSGKSWDVKIKRVDGELYMKDGWPEFAMDNGLTEKDYLTFRWLRHSSSFKVSIYGANCSSRHPTSSTSDGGHENVSESEDDSVKEIKSENVSIFSTGESSSLPSPTSGGGYDNVSRSFDGSIAGIKSENVSICSRGDTSSLPSAQTGSGHRNVSMTGCSSSVLSAKRGRWRPLVSPTAHDDHTAWMWRYVKQIKKHHLTYRRMEMPKSFVMGTGIARSGCREIEVENAKGKKWKVTLTDRNVGVFSLCRGWRKFMRWCRPPVGSVLLFEFVPNSCNVVRVSVMEDEAGKMMLARAGKGGIIYKC